MIEDDEAVGVEQKLKHMEFLQLVIGRMASNSASVKGYCVTISGILIGLAAAVDKPNILLYSLPLLLFFAFLDVQYLNLERGFRVLFDEIRVQRENVTNFEMRPRGLSVKNFLGCLLSWSIFWFYMPLLVLFVVIYCVV